MKMNIRTIGSAAPAVADRDGMTSVEVKGRSRGSAFLRRLFLLACLAWYGVCTSAQETSVHGGATLLPPPTGDAFTLVPKDMQDITCAVLKWKDEPSLPTLAIICPPQDIFAPLHIYLKLSWLTPDDVPSSAHRITAMASSITKMRTNKSTAWLWLDVREEQGAASHKTWVGFNAVEDLALLPLHSKH
jgi:hypothetical protein